MEAGVQLVRQQAADDAAAVDVRLEELRGASAERPIVRGEQKRLTEAAGELVPVVPRATRGRERCHSVNGRRVVRLRLLKQRGRLGSRLRLGTKKRAEEVFFPTKHQNPGTTCVAPPPQSSAWR